MKPVVPAVLALMVCGVCAQAADLAKLRPSAAWLRTERLRGTLFHQPNVDAMPTKILEPALPNARGKPVPVTLRGRHYLLIVVDRSGKLDVTVRNVDASPHFGQCLFAVYSPEGNELRTGGVNPGRAEAIALSDLAPGGYVLLLNSGPASPNAAEVTIANRNWAIDNATARDYVRSPMHYHFLRDLKLGGFTLAMPDVEGLSQPFMTDEGLKDWTRLVKRWTDYAARVKLRIMPAIDLGGTSYEIEAWQGLPTGLYLEHFKDMPVAPCPLRREYWDAILLRRAREIARLARDNPYVVGIGIDPEMYQAWNYGHYMMSGTCFCDHCLGGFLKAKGLDQRILEEKRTGQERWDWLVAQKLQEGYFRSLADRMAEVARSCRDELHAIDPGFMICVYVLEIGNWFCEGLARGFSQSDLPAINFCEATYYSLGYDPEWLKKTHAMFDGWRANVLQGSALWDLHFPPTKPSFLAAHAYNCGVNDEGWWYWPGDDLYRDSGATHAYLNQPATFDQYWEACDWANWEIEKSLAQSGRQSPLAQAEVVPWKGMLQGDGIKGPPEIIRSQSEPPFSACLGAPGTLYFAVPERVTAFNLLCQARGADNAAVVTVRDPSGAAVGSARGELDAPTEIKVSTARPGVWSVEFAREGNRPLRSVGLVADGPVALMSSSPESCLALATKKPGLIGYWPLEEGKGTRAHDASPPPAADGVVSDAQWVAGKIGGALQFDGQHGAVNIPANWAYNNLRSFSLSAWVRLDALPEPGKGATLVNKGPEAPVEHFWWWISYPPDYALTLELGNAKHQWGRSATSGPLQWELGRWYHVVTTFTSDDAKSAVVFYRDGRKIREETLDEPFQSGGHDLKLGTYGGLHWLNGALAQVKLWDRVLTPEEVQAEYQRR
jgi:hypothetical protein